MTVTSSLAASVLICTYNRATLLRETLESLKQTRTSRRWEVVVVDNNSSDSTRETVQELAASFPVPLRYVFERRQGKSHALNTGLDRSAGNVILFTDDDVRLGTGWLDAACDALADGAVAYCGGPVRPIWGAPPPRWIDRTRGHLWGTLAILDYGTESFIFEERGKVPLGANMAVHRRLIDRIGGFNPDLGRKGRSLLGQEQAEFFSRSRDIGTRGRYVPSMEVDHHVPAARLSKNYFRRWWYWKGVSRARIDALHPVTEVGIDLRTIPHIAGVPRYILGAVPRHLVRWMGAVIRGRWAEGARHEMGVWYALGYFCSRVQATSKCTMEPAAGPHAASRRTPVPPTDVTSSPGARDLTNV
jgi:glucosyl-dolichyl phosphate glucuronosyltransferase